jgi:hypothetical protein
MGDGVALPGRKPLHQFHHVGIVGALAFGKLAHLFDQIFVALTGEPRRRQGADKARLVANLAYRDPVGRRRGGDGCGSAGQVLAAK